MKKVRRIKDSVRIFQNDYNTDLELINALFFYTYVLGQMKKKTHKVRILYNAVHTCPVDRFAHIFLLLSMEGGLGLCIFPFASTIFNVCDLIIKSPSEKSLYTLYIIVMPFPNVVFIKDILHTFSRAISL